MITEMDEAILKEEQINQVLQDYRNPFNLNSASLWTQNSTGNMVSRTTSPDIYELLKDKSTVEIVKNLPFFMIVTTGWAAPVEETDDFTPPCEAPNRRRVRLTIQVSAKGQHSIMRFEDSPNEILTDDFSQGMLEVELTRLWKKAQKTTKKSSTKKTNTNKEKMNDKKIDK